MDSWPEEGYRQVGRAKLKLDEDADDIDAVPLEVGIKNHDEIVK